MKIKHVYGNVLRIDIPLTIKIRTIEEGASSEREEPFYPDATKGCIVELANNYNRKIEYEATIKDNIVHIEDIGKISIGQYKVTVKCYDASGNPYRYMVRDIVEICDATADAGIEAGVEFNAETYTLEGAVFVSYGVEQVQADWEEEDETSKAFIKNKPVVYTKTETDAHITQQVQAERERAEYAEQALGQSIGTKQDTINDLQEIRQGAQLGATAIQEEQDPTVPQWAKAANKPSYNANEVGALPSTTKFGSTIDMVLNSTTYVLTLTLKDQDGNSLNSKSVDLPLESLVVDGRYDAASKKIILTLQSGSTIDIPVGDLVAGLQTEITSTNMLDADLVDDTNSTNKFVSAQEKETWNNKSDFSGSYNDLTDKPVIPVVPTNVSAFNNDAGYLTEHQDISGKVDKVEGKGLSTNDYTDEEKEKLAGLENYDDTQVRQLINEEKTARQQGDAALSESITQEETRAKGVEQTLQLAIDTINGKIPAQATPQNQLADKDFVNSSVSTATADFKGTYNSLEDLQQVTANANDYAFVIANDAAGNTLYKRYKWIEGSGWVWEYDLNNSSFTAAQWAAIQSGITAALVTKLSELPDNSTLNQRITQAIANALLNYYTKSEIDTALGNKQDVIQDLAAIRSGASAGATAVQPADMSEAIDEVVQGLENGNIIPAIADTLEPWADQKAIATPDTYTDAVRTTGGDIPIETSAGSKLESIKPVSGSKWTAKLLFNGSYNMLNAAKWGDANSQPYVGGVGNDFVYFLVPELTLGTFGTADENNGLLFTDEDGVNVQPASVYFKPLGTTVPQSLTDGTSITPTNVSYDGKTYKTYETSGAGWLIIPKSYYDNDICVHIAWEDWYDKHVSLNESDTNPEAVVGTLILEGLLTLAHSDKYLLGVNDDVCDNIVFGETSATITHMVDELSVAANAWNNAATGESDSHGNALYRHSATISGIKQGGAACVEGEDGGIPLTVNGTTVSYIDTNATAPASIVFYQIPTSVETTKSYSDSVFSGSNINQETGILPINDCSIEAQVAMDGMANITVKYAKNIVDQVAINATVDVPQIKHEVEEHEERLTDLEDTAVRTGSYDATVAVGLADNLKGDTIVDGEFYKRKTGGTQSVGSGIAAIKEIRGKSIVWNQVFERNIEVPFDIDNTNGSSVTYAYIGGYDKCPRFGTLTLNHKYYINIHPTFDEGSDIYNQFYTASNQHIPLNTGSRIWTCTNGNIGDLRVLALPVGKHIYGKMTCALIDLTLMFGAGNEPTTVAEFEKMFPLNYYDYNAGTIIPFAAQNLTTIGKNQYNPTSGKANLLGGQTYQIGGTFTSATINGVAVILDSNNCFTTTEDCVLDVTGGNDAATIVALYNGENNTFEPYEKHTLSLDPSQWRDTDGNLVFPYGGMHGVGIAYDYTKADTDGYIRKVVRVIERRAYESGDTELTNVITDGSTYTFYPLETPVELTLASPIYAKYLVDKDGTEEITPANGSTPYTTMANISALYAMDARGEIQNLPKNYLSKENGEEIYKAMGRTGVISQTQTWTSDFSSYTMSDIVIGLIPQAAIDLYEEAGATFNENGYQEGIGYFEMNGITDLSYQNIKDAYDFSYHNNGQWTNLDILPRTNFPLCNGINFNSGIRPYNRAISFHLYYLNGRIEVLRLSRKLTGNYGATLSSMSGYLFYYSGSDAAPLREVMGVMNVYNVSSFAMLYLFNGAPQLKTIKLYELRGTISLSSSPVLSLDSVVYMVQNRAETNAITITLHPDVYAVCQADTTEYTYQGNTYTGIIALATAKNITIATV